MASPKQAVPGSISEEYYQISEAILSSFPKFRPPLDLFRLNEDLGQVQVYSRKGSRLSNEQVEEIHELCHTGDLFVSREDHPIYSQHIVKQLDLVLVDQNLKEGEVADITLRALAMRLEAFLEQPVRPVFDLLFTDVMVATEYLWADRHRLKLFMRRLHTGEYSLIQHSCNCFTTGLWLLDQTQGEDLRRREFDRVALGMLLHDAGMSKVPAFITSKTTPLKPDERDKIPPHAVVGAKLAMKLELVFDEVKQVVLEHHERLDGSGYPQKLSGENISRLGRLAAVADSFSAMIQTRAYAPAKSPVDAARELAADKKRYDPRFTMPLMTAFVTNAFSTK
ncbi:HD domain-containing protein [Desulfovibrio sp. OttesenSCG-928-I05]|nr:HD domain-containing protein [Desulfovibrio sp. OttesenSCG-928-I05]